MKEKAPMGTLIKKFILLRGKTTEQVAQEIDTNYKTFCGWLNRDYLPATQLFQLAHILDIDLNWMACALGYYGDTTSLLSVPIPRMQQELRQHEYPRVKQYLSTLIKENPNNIVNTRNQLLDAFHIFYLLDVLLPERQEILVHTERKKEKYYCLAQPDCTTHHLPISSQTTRLMDGKEALDYIIAERMK